MGKGACEVLASEECSSRLLLFLKEKLNETYEKFRKSGNRSRLYLYGGR
jgi:hypothetical protein